MMNLLDNVAFVFGCPHNFCERFSGSGSYYQPHAGIEPDRNGAAFVVGHAFGNRVARMLATLRPDLVRAASLVAANVGHAASPPVVREAIKASANPAVPDAERLKTLQFAFFASSNDTHKDAHQICSE